MTEQEAEQIAMIYESGVQRIAVDPETVGAFLAGGWVLESEWERSRHSPEWSCPVEGCTLKPLHTHGEFEPNEWSRLVAEERAHQVEVGYDAKHDSEHGLDHLLGWAEDYLRRDRRVEAGALIRAARELAYRVVAAPSDTDRAALIARIQREMESYDPETLGDEQLDKIERRLSNANGLGLDEAVARHYREDVPALLAEVRSLRLTVAKVREYAEDRAAYGRWGRTVDSARIASDLFTLLGVTE